MTVLDLITRALQDLNQLDGSTAPTAEDANLCFDRANDWLDDLKNEGLTVAQILRSTWTIVSGTASYTVGTAGTVAIERPISPQAISNIGFQDTSISPTYERLIGPVLTEDQFAGIPQKTLTATYPTGFYYSPTLPTGTLKPFPIPTSGTLQGVIYAPSPVAEFTSLTQTIVFAPGFRRFVRNALVVEIASAFEKQPPPAAVQAMVESRGKIKRANERLRDVSFDVALVGGGRSSDIYSG